MCRSRLYLSFIVKQHVDVFDFRFHVEVWDSSEDPIGEVGEVGEQGWRGVVLGVQCGGPVAAFGLPSSLGLVGVFTSKGMGMTRTASCTSPAVCWGVCGVILLWSSVRPTRSSDFSGILWTSYVFSRFAAGVEAGPPCQEPEWRGS